MALDSEFETLTWSAKLMSVYIIADIKITDDSWVPDYAANVHDIVHKHGENIWLGAEILR